MGLFGGSKSSTATSNGQSSSEGAKISSGSWVTGGGGADWLYYSALAGSCFLLWYAWKKAKNKRVK